MSHETSKHRDDSDEVAPIEQVLTQFAPQAARVDRDRLMFLAGAAAETGARGQGPGARSLAAVRRGSRLLWPAATAALAATSLALAVALFVQPQPRVEIVYVERPAAAEVVNLPDAAAPATVTAPAAVVYQTSPRPAARPSPRLAGDNYLRTREVALRMGLDALGTSRSAGGGSTGPTYLDWLSGLAMPPSPTQRPEAEPRPQM